VVGHFGERWQAKSDLWLTVTLAILRAAEQAWPWRWTGAMVNPGCGTGRV